MWNGDCYDGEESCCGPLGYFFLPHCTTTPLGPGLLRYRAFTITLRHITLLSIALDQSSARRRDLYLHSTQHSPERHIRAPLRDSYPQSQQVSGHKSTS
jgi:hypothetical protein